jgi:chemotaxis protein MotB
MSFRGEKYDGDLFGGSVNFTERGDSFDNESKTGRNASSKRTARQVELVDSEESPFQESGDKDRYLLTYSDLITLLLGLFIILYAISNVDNNKYKSVVAAFDNYFGNEKLITTLPEADLITGAKEKLSEELSKLIIQNNYSNSIQLEENERGITLHILENILFAPGKADLNDMSRSVLKKIADVIRKIPNDIRIEGFTDNTPINTSQYPSNWHLSSSRALNTAYYLIESEGISPEKVSVVGNGENKPIAGNDLPETRAKNRRVDIVILK